MLTLRDGAKELPLLEDKNSIEVGEISNLVDALETIRSAVIAGELDDQLLQMVVPRKTKPTKKAKGAASGSDT